MIQRYAFVTLNALGAMYTALPEGTYGMVMDRPEDTHGMFYRVYIPFTVTQPDTTTRLWYLNADEFNTLEGP